MPERVRVQKTGGVLGQLRLVELRESKKGLDKVLKNQKGGLTEPQVRSLKMLRDHVQHVIEDHTSVGRII